MTRRLFIILSWIALFILLLAYHTMFSFDRTFLTAFGLGLIDLASVYGGALVINKYLVPGLLARKKTGLFIVLLLAVLFIFSKVLYLLDWAWYTFRGMDSLVMNVFHTFQYQIFSSYLVIFLGCLCSLAYHLVAHHLQVQRKYDALQKEKAQAELNFLKAQINPHFLFNSINSIYACIDKSNTEARNMVLRFSDMLRYQLYECNTDRIAIEQEINFLGSYIDLQKSRKENQLRVDFEVGDQLQGFRIPPLLLIPFVENAFKYVSNDEKRDNRMIIRLSRKEGQFGFYCYNTCDLSSHESQGEDSGIGIENVKRRLELQYGGSYQLDIHDSGHAFEVTLNLKTP